MFHIEFYVLMIFALMSVVVALPLWKIFGKAGLSRWWSFGLLIPIINIVVVYYLAFAKKLWSQIIPNQENGQLVLTASVENNLNGVNGDKEKENSKSDESVNDAKNNQQNIEAAYSDIKKLFFIIIKIIGVVISLVLVIFLVSFLYSKTIETLLEYEKDKVDISVIYDIEGKCSNEEYPLYIEITNKSNRTILETEFKLKITRRGYSRNTISYSGRKSYLDDKIIEPGIMSWGCWRFPLLMKKYNDEVKKDLVYQIEWRDVKFEDD